MVGIVCNNSDLFGKLTVMLMFEKLNQSPVKLNSHCKISLHNANSKKDGFDSNISSFQIFFFF